MTFCQMLNIILFFLCLCGVPLCIISETLGIFLVYYNTIVIFILYCKIQGGKIFFISFKLVFNCYY